MKKLYTLFFAFSCAVFSSAHATAITSTINSHTNVSCNGGSDGWATVNASGGMGTLTYNWAPSGGNGATAFGLSANTYT